MRIAISGAQGVGKSTLCEYLTINLTTIYPTKTIETIGNISRDLAKRLGVSIDTKSTIEDYYLYNTEYIKRLINNNADIIIHDRTLLDSMAYQLYNNNAPSNYYTMLRELVRWYIIDISYYFYIPIQFEMEDDGIRHLDKQHQKEIAAIILSLLSDYKVKYSVIQGTIQNRINAIVEELDESF